MFVSLVFSFCLCVLGRDLGDAEHAATWLSEGELPETMRNVVRTIREHQGRCRLRCLRRGTESDSSNTTTSCSGASKTTKTTMRTMRTLPLFTCEVLSALLIEA